ncbi:MAG: HipA domain-containing protein [Treponema sp.]|nr:HipA domain-containing protein [Treponema sp.]
MKLARLSLGVRAGPGTIQVELKQAFVRECLEIQRYDRREIADDANIKFSERNGEFQAHIPKQIERMHQEYFCQALGYLAKRKYQADGGPKIRDPHNATLEYSWQKSTDSYLFTELFAFNHLIGNAGARAKNFSLLHVNEGGRTILAPVYALLSTEAYPEKTASHEIAVAINGKGKYDKITKNDWLALFEQLRLNPTTATQEMTASSWATSFLTGLLRPAFAGPVMTTFFIPFQFDLAMTMQSIIINRKKELSLRGAERRSNLVWQGSVCLARLPHRPCGILAMTTYSWATYF